MRRPGKHGADHRADGPDPIPGGTGGSATTFLPIDLSAPGPGAYFTLTPFSNWIAGGWWMTETDGDLYGTVRVPAAATVTDPSIVADVAVDTGSATTSIDLAVLAAGAGETLDGSFTSEGSEGDSVAASWGHQILTWDLSTTISPGDLVVVKFSNAAALGEATVMFAAHLDLG